MSTIIGLDVGERRIGVARAHTVARLAEPLTTLQTDEFSNMFPQLIESEDTERVVVGLPRGMNGQDTAQTTFVRKFVSSLKLTIPVSFQDEAVTSVKAEEYLKSLKKQYKKDDIDAAAAAIILQDYLEENPE